MDMTGVKLTELVEAAGCAAKLAPGYLSQVLAELPRLEDDKLLVGFEASDDAYVYDLGDGRGLVGTTDFFPPMVDDPFLFGQVAAANALSDVWAMGGTPVLALNLLCFPNCLGLEVAGQILAGGADKCREAGVIVAGGHSINDHEPKFGLAVSGFVDLERLLANRSAREGDVLVLTKALGTGILTSAHKGGILDDEGVKVATDSMITLNKLPIELARGLELHACTDVTGFSLMGHGCEMAEASGLTACINASDVPVMARAREMARMGLIPAGAYRNRDFFGPRVSISDDVPLDLSDVLFDPQTSGGLLLAMPEGDADELVSRLRDAGQPAAVVGSMVAHEGCSVRVR